MSNQQEEYDPWNEVPNDVKIQNCYSLVRWMALVIPAIGIILYLFKGTIVNRGWLTAEAAQQIFGGFLILAIFLAISIIFILGYLRRKLKQENEENTTDQNPKSDTPDA